MNFFGSRRVSLRITLFSAFLGTVLFTIFLNAATSALHVRNLIKQSVQEKISPKTYEKLDDFYKKNYKKFFDRKTKRKFLEAERTLTVALLGRAKKPVLKRVKKNSRS